MNQPGQTESEISGETQLVASVMTAQYRATTEVMNSLIDLLTHELAGARARERAVEAGIRRLFSGRHMPTESAILRALDPSPEFVALFREAQPKGRVE